LLGHALCFVLPCDGELAALTHLGELAVYTFHGNPTRGAAQIAPTAPHATPPSGTDKSGPARFWATRALRIAACLALGVSLVVHGLVVPWHLLPDRTGIEFKDVDGELTIPIDLLSEAPTQPPPSSAEERQAPVSSDPNALMHKLDASAPKAKPKNELDASAPDASHVPRDGGGPSDAGHGDAALDASGLVASGDAGGTDAGGVGGVSGPRDPGSMIGLSGLVTAGQVNVTLLVNLAVIRTNPVGARIGPVLFAIPQWRDFMQGSQSTIDPIRDTDWILIYGPSLIHTDRDAVLVHYSAPDALVDSAVDAIAQRYENGGTFDAGVAGVRASLGHADNAERVFMRVQPHVLVVVPKDKANEFARVLKRAPVAPKVRPGEAMRLTVKDPSKQIAIPGLKFSQSLSELRLWIVPRASDGGAEVLVEGDCTSEEAAVDTADAMTDLIRRQNSSWFVQVATSHLLDGARVLPDGKLVKLQISARQDQLESILNRVGAYFGIDMQPGTPR